MREIKLTQGQVALVDDNDFGWLNQWKWQALKSKKTFYAKRAGGKIYMHRLILGIVDRRIHTDHKDHNGLNNQRLNIRAASVNENMANRTARKNCTSKYKGVFFDTRSSKWVAKIQKDGKIKQIGMFKNEIDAAKAYNTAATIIHGDFANLNKIAI